MNTFIFVSGGLVQDVIGPNVKQVHIIDFDNLEGGGCPICGAVCDGELIVCAGCGYDWSNDDYETIMQHIDNADRVAVTEAARSFDITA